MDGIICDIDDTLVDTRIRKLKILDRLGIEIQFETSKSIDAYIETLEPEVQNKFYVYYLSDDFGYDPFNFKVVECLRICCKEFDCPVIIITGRPTYLKNTYHYIGRLKEFCIPVYVCHARDIADPETVVEFKLDIIERYNYNPVVVLEDNIDIIRVLQMRFNSIGILVKDGEYEVLEPYLKGVVYANYIG